MIRINIFLPTVVLLLGCSSALKKEGSSGSGKSYVLQLKGSVGETQFTRYYSAAQIQNFEASQKTKDRLEIVDFTVRAKTVEVDPGSKAFVTRVATTRKDGTASLHEMAFPELDEEIEFVLNKEAQILRAGNYPPESLFYVPFLPLPKSPVEVGDTWPLEHSWVSSPSGIPLRLDLIAIFKGVAPCGKNQICADLELSGKVLVDAPTQPNTRFDGNILGRVLFNIERGTIESSETRSSEDMLMGGDRIKVTACLRSKLEEKPSKPSRGDGFQCTP